MTMKHILNLFLKQFLHYKLLFISFNIDYKIGYSILINDFCMSFNRVGNVM